VNNKKIPKEGKPNSESCWVSFLQEMKKLKMLSLTKEFLYAR